MGLAARHFPAAQLDGRELRDNAIQWSVSAVLLETLFLG